MTKFALTIVLIMCGLFANAQNPTGYFHYAPYLSIDGSTYVETYLAIAGNSVTYKSIDEENEQASVEVTMVFKNDDVVKAYRKFILKSDEIEIGEQKKPSFLNLERFSLENGTYNFELTIKDNYVDSSKFTHSDIITIDIPDNTLTLSGITLAETIKPTNNRNQFSKSGYDIIPYVSNFYPDQINKLQFYAELYNTDKIVGQDSSFIIKTYIEGSPTRILYTEYATLERKKAAPINVIIKSYDISKLNSGNYNLIIEVRNKKNELLGEFKKFFQRSNSRFTEMVVDYTSIDVTKTFAHKITNFEELKEHVYALYPIANNIEQRFILQDFTPGQTKIMQQFLYNFWKERNPSNPESDWNIYKSQLAIVQKHFGYGRRRGYATDLGRIYLKYGSPSSIKEDHLGQQQIIQSDNPGGAMVDAVDYQIWHYYKINEQTDRIFVFVKGLDKYNLGPEYILLYSDVAGETGYTDGLNFTSITSLLNNVDSKLLQDIQSESARALSRFLSGRK